MRISDWSSDVCSSDLNRKEAKTHGEGGSLIGAPLRGRIVIVDDVITAGTAIRESVAIIQDAGAEVAGIVLALDRQERGQTRTEERRGGKACVSTCKSRGAPTH